MEGTVLVTGGAGFIGSHLCDRLLADGHDVICVDNFISGTRENIAHLANNPKFELVEHDVTQQLTVNRQLTAIFHFASLASPNPESPVSYMRYPVETMLTNIVGAKNMLDLAVANDCQIIFASTAEVYGNPEFHPQSEDYVGHVSPIGIRSSYDEGKRAMEALAFAYMREKDAKIKVIRIFNTYGPRMRLDDGRIVPNLLRSLVQGTPFAIHGDGSTTRSFAFVSDVVEGVMRVMGHKNMEGDVVNIGNPREFTLTETLGIFERIAGKKLLTIEKPAPAEDPVRRSPDISKAKKVLNWEPVTDFESGLKKTIETYV